MFYNPIVLSLVLLLAAAGFSKRKTISRTCFWMAVGILLLCGNSWVTGAFAKHLERRHLPPDPVPEADCILVLGGGVLGRSAPQPTVQITDAGNRVLYAVHLYRQGRASRILCSGGATGGGVGARSEAEDMAELLEMLGVPKEAIITETKARNTHEHATNLYSFLQSREFKRVLLVTSAMHMPRSLGVFRRLCPGIEFIAAPTDFRALGCGPSLRYQPLSMVIPKAGNLLNWSDAMHEYLGIAYYWIRGWI